MINGGPKSNKDLTAVFLCYILGLELKWVLISADLRNTHNKLLLG